MEDYFDVASDRQPEGAERCPFCGSSALSFVETRLRKGKNVQLEAARVECQSCFCHGPELMDGADDVFSAAVELWNRRS